MARKAKQPTRISASDFAYHRKIIERMRQAQDAQQKIVQLQQTVGAAQAAFESWGIHLHERYDLSPGDGVDESGKITRGPSVGNEG